MSLRVWLPLNGNLYNQGLDGEAEITPDGFSVNNNGKIGKCMKLTGNKGVSYTPNFNKESFSIGGWFKFNKEEINTVLKTLTYTSTSVAATGNLVGNTSYGGIGLIWVSNNMYTTEQLSTLRVFATLRTPSVNKSSAYVDIDFDVWTHFLLIWDANNFTLYFYKNGSLISKVVYNDFTDGKIELLRLNRASVYGGNYKTTSIPIYINDFRIYDHILSIKQIKQISKGLILHYKLDDPYIEPTLNYLGSKGETFVNIWSSYGFGSKGQITLATNQQSVCGGEVALVTNKTTETKATTTEIATRFTGIQSTIMNTNDTFTISAYVKGTSQTIGKTCFVHLYNSNGTDTKSNGTSYILTNQWQRITHTMTWTAANPSSNSGNCYVAAAIKGGESFYVCNVQVEKLNHATPYTSLSRTDCFISDSSGYQNNGTIVGNIQTVSDSPRYAAVASFNGTSAINCVSLTPEAKTVSLWVKWDAIPSYQSVVFLDYKSKLGLGLMSTGILCGTSGPGNYNTFSKTGLIANTWYHFVVINPGKVTETDRKLYINGVQQEKTSNTSNWTYNVDQIQIGKRSTTSDGLIGKISDVRLYATVLSPEDIKELYQTSALIDRNQNLYVRELVEI